ncbi:uncharacterized protein [Procambarus clarkii]|uniref:uncharacterized protein isoform X3 n=1 Tax=Procambarus clarkii TaxID=6728 RepID=UPI0037434CB7
MPPTIVSSFQDGMSLFRMPRFLRRFVRRNTSEIPVDRASQTKQRLSIAYAVVAWHLFGVLVYLVHTKQLKVEENTSGLSQGRQFAKMLKLENPHLYQIQGVTSVKHFDLNEEFEKESEENTSDI